MNPTALLRKVWTDSVWSKVIASAITTSIATVVVAAAPYWETLKGIKDPLLRVALTPVTMPAWLATILGLLLMVVAAFSLRERYKSGADGQQLQPNAIPIVEATVVEPSSDLRGQAGSLWSW